VESIKTLTHAHQRRRMINWLKTLFCIHNWVIIKSGNLITIEYGKEYNTGYYEIRKCKICGKLKKFKCVS